MTIDGAMLQAGGYSGQKYRILIDVHHFDRSVQTVRLGWSNGIDHDWLRRSGNGDANWSNLRYEEVTDPTTEGAP